MMTLGITGRSGCGKSTVTAYFSGRGIPCADADRIARDVLAPGSPCLAPLEAAFGADIFVGGQLNRRLLADRAFSTPAGTKKLTEITHPEIVRRVLAAQTAARQAGSPLFCVDGAVLIGSAFEQACDRILVVTAPFDISVARICARDGISAEMAARRLHAQMAEPALLEKADYILRNDSTAAALTAQAAALLDLLLKGTKA
ncbi:MAG: dephospho-CoA kinase [Faecalibacterium sp.]|jgi:dephospho-CoA kinase|nr:dephospho-CoA kinase [Faecalibacterium sp.]